MKAILLVLIGLCLCACSDNSSNLEKHQQSIKAEIKIEEQKQADSLKVIVQNFYDQLSETPGEQTAQKATTYMTDNWKSTPTPAGGEGIEGFVKTLYMFHGMIPDLKWEVQEMLVSGNQVTVRSIASGTPNSPEGYFFGVPTDGSKSFNVQTIDIHTIEDGKFVSSFHVEDWATAIQQVSPAN